MTHEIKERHKRAISAILSANERVERAVLYGSRALKTNKATSDVDIVLFGDRLTYSDRARLSAVIDAIPMAHSVDLALYHKIQNESLRRQIQDHGIEWFTRTEPSPTPC